MGTVEEHLQPIRTLPRFFVIHLFLQKRTINISS